MMEYFEKLMTLIVQAAIVCQSFPESTLPPGFRVDAVYMNDDDNLIVEWSCV